MKCSIKQDVFLANGANKSRFITVLSKNLRRTGNKVVECEEDADTHIVRCTLELATTGVHVHVVADDTDVALLLLYHWNDTMADITITFERTKASFSIKSSINSHSSLLKPYLLVLHSSTGLVVILRLLSTRKAKPHYSRRLKHLCNFVRCWIHSEIQMLINLKSALLESNYFFKCMVEKDH